VSSRESWVTRVTGQLTDGSRGLWVIECDPLSALVIIISSILLPLAPCLGHRGASLHINKFRQKFEQTVNDERSLMQVNQTCCYQMFG